MADSLWVRSGPCLLRDIEQAVVPANAVALWFLGQMGFVIKGANTIVYVDPYLVESWRKDAVGTLVSRRRFPPPFAGEDVAHANVVLGTHNHSDHINIPTLSGMAAASPQAAFVVPAPHVGVLTAADIAPHRVMAACAFQTFNVGNLQVTPIPAAHEALEQDAHGNYLAVGYLMQLNGITLFHAGDTLEYPELIDNLRKYEIDVCFLPINGRDALRTNKGIIGNMNFREAADVGVACGARLIIPGHYDVFPHNGENPAFFVDYMYRTYPQHPFKLMAPGERTVYMR